jgi:peptidoglycan/xylan/chitin deacetylase (PgdA/CDA1 family)
MAERGRRGAAATLFDRAGAAAVVSALRRRVRGRLTILAYHRVLDVPDEDAYEHDIELVSASVDGFDQQVAHLARHYHPMTFREVLGCLDRGEPLPAGACVITFDDGFADNYLNAFPVLQRWKVPATIFVATGYLDAQETFWYDRLAHAVLKTKRPVVSAEGVPPITLGADIAHRRGAVKDLLNILKRMPDAQRRANTRAMLEDLLPQAAAWNAASAPMTWEMVAEMSRGGIEFGSHTVNHPVLSRLGVDELRMELRDSKRRIEEVVGTPVEVIAYPVGGSDAFTGLVQREVRSAGYRLGLTYMAGVDHVSTWNPYAIRRLQVERYLDGAWFRAMLASPEIFAYGTGHKGVSEDVPEPS